MSVLRRASFKQKISYLGASTSLLDGVPISLNNVTSDAYVDSLDFIYFS